MGEAYLFPWIILIMMVVVACIVESEKEDTHQRYKDTFEQELKHIEYCQKMVLDDELEDQTYKDVRANTHEAIKTKRDIQKQLPDFIIDNYTVVMIMMAKKGKIPRDAAIFGISVVNTKEDIDGHYSYPNWLKLARQQRDFMLWYNDILKQNGLKYDLQFVGLGHNDRPISIYEHKEMRRGTYFWSQLDELFLYH